MDNSSRLNHNLEVNNADLQNLQDSFCKSNDMYLVCISKEHGQLTSFSGSSAEEDFVDSYFKPMLRHEIMDAFLDGVDENIVQKSTDDEGFMYSGVAIRDDGEKVYGVWLCFGVESTTAKEANVPEYVRTTTKESFDKSISLLETLTKYYFAAKIKASVLADQVNIERDTQEEIAYKLKKNEIMTDILRLMESESSFSKLSEDILRESGKYLDCTHTALLQLSPEGLSVDMISEWAAIESDALTSKFQDVPLVELPFMNGKPYTISSDSNLPEAFEILFNKYGMKAAIFLPINVNDTAAMYLCFLSIGVDRKWSVDDLRFANDIKRMLHTILVKKISTNSLASSYNALEAILKNAGYGVVVADVNTKELLYSNDTYQKMFEDEVDKLAVQELIFDERYSFPEINGYSANGSGRWFDVSVDSIKWVDGRMVRMITFYDTTELRLYQKKVERQAQEDILTGLYNRQACEKDIAMEFHVAKKLDQEFAVLLIDLDDFDHVNEGMGYKLGDDLLEYVAHSINDISYIKGKCYRVGGDEFAVLVDHETYPNLDLIIKRITTLFDNPWILDGQDYMCTMSMGCVKAPEDMDNAVDILNRLNIALKEAKNKGKNRYEFFSPKSEVVIAQKAKLEQALKKAVEDGCKEFEVYFQPIMEFTSGVPHCCGAEALVRWNSAEYGLMLPEKFISEAEQLRLISALDDFVLNEAALACRKWNDFGHPEFRVNVNLSTADMLTRGFVEKVQNVIEETSVTPANLTFEVTEELAANDMDKMVEVLTALKKLGCNIALDDFGKGYSSLNYIRTMPLDIIKIDKDLISEIKTNRFSEAFIKTISELAKSVDVDVCIEGVEADTQLDMIDKFSVSLAQGYYFDKPLTKAEFEKKYTV